MHGSSRYLAAVSLLGLIAIGAGAMAQTGPSPTLRDWFQRHDRNVDSAIDREEFQQAVVEAFYFRDTTRSGYLTAEQLQGASPEAVRAASRKDDHRLSLDEYINALFRDFEAMDGDADGKLTIDEIASYIRLERR